MISICCSATRSIDSRSAQSAAREARAAEKHRTEVTDRCIAKCRSCNTTSPTDGFVVSVAAIVPAAEEIYPDDNQIEFGLGTHLFGSGFE